MTHQPRRMSYESEEMYGERIRQYRSGRRMLVSVAWVIGVLLLVFVWLMVHVYNVASAWHSRFMSQCMQDHKEHECTAMWRAGDSASPTLIVIPSGN